jgi:Acetyltransferase (GNAT) family
MSQSAAAITIRPMNEGDVPELIRLMRAIVSFERGQNFSLNEAELLRRGFGARPEFGAYVADAGTGSLAGMAVHYEIPFMHTLQPLLMLKWLYVDPECRNGRVGQRLMRQMALCSSWSFLWLPFGSRSVVCLGCFQHVGWVKLFAKPIISMQLMGIAPLHPSYVPQNTTTLFLSCRLLLSVTSTLRFPSKVQKTLQTPRCPGFSFEER